MMTSNLVQTIRPEDGLTNAQSAAILQLTALVWPPDAGEEPPQAEETLARWRTRDSVHFLIGEGEQPVLAHGLIFRREIFTARGPLQIGALATVCVHPSHRGRGWGADIVRAAFDFLPELGVAVSLFQTPVPDFYQKLGCRTVTNRFFDGTRADKIQANPFWDASEMIYPASFDWPDGEIDLNGPGY